MKLPLDYVTRTLCFSLKYLDLTLEPGCWYDTWTWFQKENFKKLKNQTLRHVPDGHR